MRYTQDISIGWQPIMRRLVRVSMRRVATLVFFVVVVPGAIMMRSAEYLFHSSLVSQSMKSATTHKDTEVLAAFLQEYNRLCESKTPPRGEGDPSFCPCLPENPAGWFDVDGWYSQLHGYPKSPITHQWTDLPQPQPLDIGGHWEPTSCFARQRVAIIVPFRNREEHLHVFVKYMHPFLQSQLLDYTIFVIEQSSPDIFNRAALMNVGYLEANKLEPEGFDCYIFHDIDLLPEDDRNMYTCYMSPLHLGAYMNKFDYEMPYTKFFGGAISLSRSHVLKINGFANHFYGWGGEDDDTYNRVLLRNLTINRYPQVVGQSYMLKHDADGDNPKNPLRDWGYKKKVEEYDRVGLSSIKYTRNMVAWTQTYTKVTVSIERDFDNKCIIDKHISPTMAGNYKDCQRRENFEEGEIECCTSSLSSEIYCCDTTNSEVNHEGRYTCVPCVLVLVCSIVMRLFLLIKQWRKR